MGRIFCGIFSGIVILVSALMKRDEEDLHMKDSAYNILTLILFAAFIFLLFLRVDEVPIPYHTDEAGAIYDGVSIAKYHCDRYSVRFPVYFMNYGTHGSSALYGYSAAIIFSLLGYSITAARLPAIILSLLASSALTMIMRREKGDMASLLTIAFFCILPFSIMHSRWGLDAYLLFPMLTISCSIFRYTVETGKIKWFVLTGISFGITLYSYSVSYILLPLLLGVNLMYLLLIKKINRKQILAMGIPLFCLAVPLIMMIAVNNGFIPEIRTRFFSIPKLSSYGVSDLRLKNIIDNLSFGHYNIFYRIFVDDFLLYNAIPRFGTVYFISIPLVIYGFFLSLKGMIHSFQTKEYHLDFLMVTLFCLVFCINLFTENTNINRLCAIYIPIIYFLVSASINIVRKRKILAIFAGGLYLVCFSFFIHYYFNDFNEDINESPLIGSITDMEAALLFAESVNQNNELIYILDPLHAYVYTLLIKDIDPFTFNEEKILSYDEYVKVLGNYRFRLDAVMPECIYIFKDWNKMPKNLDSYGFSSKQFGSYWVYYPELNQITSDVGGKAAF